MAIDDGLRLLRRRCVVEVHQRLAANQSVQDGEVAPIALDLEGRRLGHYGVGAAHRVLSRRSGNLCGRR